MIYCRTYLWYDEKGKKNRCPAPQYIDYVMTYTQRTIGDESYFPTKYAKGKTDKDNLKHKEL